MMDLMEPHRHVNVSGIVGQTPVLYCSGRGILHGSLWTNVSVGRVYTHVHIAMDHLANLVPFSNLLLYKARHMLLQFQLFDFQEVQTVDRLA